MVVRSGAVVKAITEEGIKIKSMIDQYIAKRIAFIDEHAQKEKEELTKILLNNKTALAKAYTLLITGKGFLTKSDMMELKYRC